MSDEVLRLAELRKSYNVGLPTEVEVLHGIDLALGRQDFAALVGPSGSGKSTLLNLLGLLDSPTSGEVFLLGQPTREMDDPGRTRLRGSAIGFVFQFHHLLPAFSAIENVIMPLMVTRGRPDAETVERARMLLAAVDLEAFAERKPSQLSGGQQQRVAIARALVNGPALLLADEPTGNLGTDTSVEIMAILQRLNASGLTVVLVTHEPDIAAYAQRQITFRDGVIAHDTPIQTPRRAVDELPGGGTARREEAAR